jgi:hypothetical protein
MKSRVLLFLLFSPSVIVLHLIRSFIRIRSDIENHVSINWFPMRTRNLLIRSQTPYPLGHAVIGIKILKMVLKHRIQGGGGHNLLRLWSI